MVIYFSVLELSVYISIFLLEILDSVENLMRVMKLLRKMHIQPNLYLQSHYALSFPSMGVPWWLRWYLPAMQETQV